MHYYKFNIGDYKSHTSHLDPIEDIAYRRMIDWLYLHEKPLPPTPNEVARLIDMRSHSDSIAVVLNEFFIRDFSRAKETKGWTHKRISNDIDLYHEKSQKAVKSAKARWDAVSDDANALRTECDGNANHKPLTTNHKPLNIPQDINPTSWKEFEDHRKQMRKPLSDLARTKAMNVIKEFTFDQQAAIIDKSIQSRWAGLFPEKSYEKNQPTNRPAESHHAGVVRMLRTRIETSNTDT